MNYEKMYKEALKMAKVVALNGHQNLMEGIFPELRESKDEKTRKEIVDYLKKNLRLEWATWLEKQGQKKYIDDLTQQEAMDIAVAKCFKQSEQNPAWSEEDEKAINDIMWIIEAYRENGFNETHKQMANNAENWLKSLKQRYTWKPRDEQMKALDSAIDEFDGYREFDSLVSLKKDLEKLKGE